MTEHSSWQPDPLPSGSMGAPTEEARRSLSPRSLYNSAVQLLANVTKSRNTVLDLGCGYDGAAELLSQAGFDYIRCNLKLAGTTDPRPRGVPAEHVDLSDGDEVARWITDEVSDRKVDCVLLLDTLGHFPDTPAFLSRLRRLMEHLRHPLLAVSVPNVANFGVAVRLLSGRWEATDTDSVESTDLQLFTLDRLRSELGGHGWMEVGGRDLLLEDAGQSARPGDPLLDASTPLSQFLRQIRGQRDQFGSVSHFVRAFAHTDAPLAPVPCPGEDTCFLTVLLRTRGRRTPALRDVLSCLAAQSDLDFEVVLLADTTDPRRLDEIDDVVAGYDPGFAGRVRVVRVLGGAATQPFNAGVEAARGRYVSLLEDDALLMANWVESFHRAAEYSQAQVVRARCSEQQTRFHSPASSAADFEATACVQFPYCENWDFITHLKYNHTPLCSVAIPAMALTSLGIRFDESNGSLDGWDLLMRVSRYTGVVDTGDVTSIRRIWEDPQGKVSPVEPARRNTISAAALRRFDAEPLLLPAGCIARLAGDVPDPPAVAELVELRRQVADLQAQLHAIQSSEWWKATAPMRALSGKLRAVLRPPALPRHDGAPSSDQLDQGAGNGNP